MARVGLVVQFNHAFVQNIPKLDRIYRNRFAKILYLVPMVKSEDPRVVTSYWGSYTFQGYVSDAAEKLDSLGCDYFVFHQDDVVLNPALNEHNLLERLPLGDSESFIPELTPFAAPDTIVGPGAFWNWTSRVLFNFLASREMTIGSGVENLFAYLPPVDFAKRRMEEQGIDMGPATIDTDLLERSGYLTDALLWRLFVKVPGPAFTISLPYPIVRAVSDFFVFPGKILMEFAHYCGLLAAGNIFVEVAIPTALVLASRYVRTIADMRGSVEWRWGNDIERFRQFERIDQVFDYFHPDLLALHPIKLSRIDVP